MQRQIEACRAELAPRAEQFSRIDEVRRLEAMRTIVAPPLRRAARSRTRPAFDMRRGLDRGVRHRHPSAPRHSG
jgi:hypothetical protein